MSIFGHDEWRRPLAYRAAQGDPGEISASALFGRDELTFKITAAIFVGQLVIAAFLGWLGLAYWRWTLPPCHLRRRLRQSRQFRDHPRRDPQLRVRKPIS